MTQSPAEKDESVVSVEGAALLALVALQVEQREMDSARTSARKTELLLADAGLTYAQIAMLLNKNVAAVRMAITRARSKET